MLTYNQFANKSIFSEISRYLPCFNTDGNTTSKPNENDEIDYEAVPTKPAQPEAKVINEIEIDENSNAEQAK
jgi:hypothetical protein